MKIQLARGLEARPVAVLVQVASQFNSSVYLESDGKKVNAKSIMGMMSLGLNAGESITVETDGSDEKEAIAKIESYLNGEKLE
jgi:catabolite repression HPr-like protein